MDIVPQGPDWPGLQPSSPETIASPMLVEGDDPHTPPSKRRRIEGTDEEAYLPNPNPNASRRRPDVTPLKRKKHGSSVGTNVKQNVIKAVARVRGYPADTPPICVVSGASDKMTFIEFSHIATGTTPLDELDSTEWSWNMPQYELCLDSRQNLQPITLELHRWYDKTTDSKPTGWFWLPDIDALFTIKTMHERYVGTEDISLHESAGETKNTRLDPAKLYAKGTKFMYRLVPFPGMDESYPVRYIRGQAVGKYNALEPFQSVYPFDDLPPYRLHIPYHYIILNTGKKLRQLYADGPIDFNNFSFLSVTHREIMAAVRSIYVSWMLSQPGSGWFEKEEGEGANVAQPDTTENQGDRASRRRRRESGGGSAHQDGSQEGQDAPAPGPSGTRRAIRSGSLEPEDSLSCLDAVGLEGDDSDEVSEDGVFVDDEEEEWEDDEFFAGIHLWSKNVWAAMQADSPTNSEVTVFEETVDLAPSKYNAMGPACTAASFRVTNVFAVGPTAFVLMLCR